ncbi:hypothetical protein AFERRI_400111 [Acidithiobacillus ferrivorans]|uniref:Uncharacterized protein n=1 Tax=Acidithiobacillus ferrivorans TaxID=160808 RepID=A0A060UPF9_9PROT|nr:hypothetical protein AFERRI_400111 [Acidithiobacillus ferrivorans]
MRIENDHLTTPDRSRCAVEQVKKFADGSSGYKYQYKCIEKLMVSITRIFWPFCSVTRISFQEK